MTTLEKIRAEIEDKRNVAGHFDTKTARAQVLALSWVIDLIDKYNPKEEEWYRAIVEAFEPCDDVVSRQWLMRKATERFYTTNYFNHITKMIEEAPSVRPQEQTGHWIAIERGYLETPRFECSECHTQQFVETCMDKPIWNYCPNCGARMVEPQESEDKA